MAKAQIMNLTWKIKGQAFSPHLYLLLVKLCCDCYCVYRNWSGRAREGSKAEHLWAGVKVAPGAALVRGKWRGGRDTFTSRVHLHMQAFSCRSNGTSCPVGLCLACPSPDPWFSAVGTAPNYPAGKTLGQQHCGQYCASHCPGWVLWQLSNHSTLWC